MTDQPRRLDETLVGSPLVINDSGEPPARAPDLAWECGMVPQVWRGVGGQVDDPAVRAERGTVRRHRWWAVWARRLGKALGWVAAGAAAVLASAVVLYLLVLTVFCGINPTELL